ncbi:putative bifunctional diguanylate cyclase/phosphodiesterase [Roseateles puraquae]|uniref:putative bifunctional diguanylate cyclase/phosphodiesterase n=1 Tax=Roseateles puraquae TaxID=431059 RepID=UPI0031D9B684
MDAASAPDLDTPQPGTGEAASAAAQGLRQFMATPLALALVYAAFGMLWILLSDRLLQQASADLATLSALAQGKGIAFVLLTSSLIYLVAARRQRAVAPPTSPDLGDLAAHERPLRLMGVFALPCVAIVAASLVSYASNASRDHAEHVERLRREAQAKANLVQGWIDRRVREARQLSADPTLRGSLLRWRRTPDEAATLALRRQLQMLLASGHYSAALMLDAQGHPVLNADDGPADLDPAVVDAALMALQQGRVSGSDFLARPGLADSLRFELLVPLLGSDGHADLVLVLRTEPRRSLLPQLLAGAGFGAPETLLVRPGPQGLLAVGLGGSDTPLVRITDSPPGDTSLAALTANPALAGTLLNGLPLAHAGRTGEPTAAVALPLPGSPWFVVVQVPRDSLHGEGVASGAALLLLVDVLAVLITGAVVFVALRRREQQTAARLAADHAEKERAWQIAEAIANSSSDLIFAKDLQGRYLFANRELGRLLGRAPATLIGKTARDIPAPDQVHHLLGDVAAVARSEQPVSLEMQLATAQGDRIYACTKGRLVDNTGQVIGVYGISSDITARRDLQQRMQQWATAFDDIRDGVIVTDPLGYIQSVNRAFSQITGYTAEEAIGDNMRLVHSGRHGRAFYEQMWTLLNQTGHWQGEIWNRRKNGEIYPEWLTIRAVRNDDGPVTHYVGVFTDISRIKDSEAQADWLFHNDPLTKLPNRAQLQRRLEQALARARRREARPALMVIDLDGFKTVNDSLGHPAGDELLICVAERLQARLRHKDCLGRLGGDEFLLIIENAAQADDLGQIARDVLAAVSEPVALSCGRDAYLTASIGISLFPDSESPTAVELLRDADAALHRAKDLGRNRYCFYTGDMHAQAMAKLELEAALSRAIEREELLLHYQPKVAAQTGEVVGAEALLRWQRGTSGLVPPGQFIPLAEQSSLILDIGAWVIDRACRQLRQWLDAGQPVVRIAVNVAARQFAAGDLDTVVAAALQRHGIDAELLELELTEGMLMSNPQQGTAMLQRLRGLGVKISLDDFGTGYSSLAYLHQFPIDTLKIDQSFVRRIGEVPDGEALVDAVIGLAHRLHLRVVAEGVETPAQRAHLLRQGCDEMQGYHFGRPAPAESLQAMLSQPRG